MYDTKLKADLIKIANLDANIMMGRVPESPTQPEGFYPKKYLQTQKILKIPQFIYYLKTQNKLKKPEIKSE